jgi:hypothetical protein
MKDYSLIPELFDVELDYDGDVVSVDYYGADVLEESKHEVGVLLDEWINKELIEVNEKTLCTVWKQDGHFVVKGKVCIEFGEDESDDIWDEFEIEIQF